jgi:hypothetical protein
MGLYLLARLIRFDYPFVRSISSLLPMKRILLSPMPWVMLVLGVILVASYFHDDRGKKSDNFRVWSLEQSPEGNVDYALLRAFVSPQGMYSVALEGGRQPIFAYEVPSVTLGSASDCPLQILLLADWDAQTTRSLFQQIEKLYHTDPSLPPLKLSFLPSRTGSASGHFMEWIMAVHFVANDVKTMPAFLHQISAGDIAADKDSIQKRLEEIEPLIVERIDPFLQSRREIVEKAYRIAQAQLRLNEKALQCTETTQLVSMKQILTGSPSEEHIKVFLLHAKTQQDSFLASPTGIIPLEPKRPR